MLLERLPAETTADVTSDTLLDRFLDHVREAGLELYPAQEEAILELYSGKNVILNTPTGSGKSLVATALHFESYSQGRRSVYTCPIKALVNEKFLALCRDFGPDQVGMITGDGSVNADARIICCTAEILSNWALREGAEIPVHDVIMDEFHYYSDRERGAAWQIPLLTMPKAKFLLMSATLGDTEFFQKDLTELTGRETVLVKSAKRPVPLEYRYEEIPLHETVAKLIEKGRAPVYVVNFTQASCAEEAQNFLSVDFCTKEEKKAIAQELEGVSFSSPYGKELSRVLKHGVGIHHAGLLPRYRILVEKLAQKGLLKIICGTDTLGVGVNVPIRTVLFTKLCKFDGQKTSILSVRDFQQIAGRAGRKGYDDLGTVVAQAPEHVIENLRNEQKAAGDPKKLKKLVKRKPPEKGFVPWNKETFDRLINSEPETLQSRFQINHGMLLQVLSRTHENGGRALRDMIRRSHESEASKKKLRKTAFQLFRSLVDRKIIELNPLRVNVDLQQDFSLHQTLSLYLIDTLPLLDRESPDFAFDVLTLVESIVEDPELILRRQLDRLKTERMAEMKAEGKEYDERIEELEKMEYPKPLRDFIYDTFNTFAANHPWVGQENIQPKSIAREMFELFVSFPEYIREYDLHRAEGLLLRYISEVYKTLEQTVPEPMKTEEIRSIEDYFRTMIRSVDSSLIDEWEKMRGGVPASEKAPVGEGSASSDQAVAADITRNVRGFTVMIRNEVFRFVRALANRRYDEALEQVEFDWGVQDLESKMDAYYQDHSRILTDPKARSPQNTRIERVENALTWKVEQILIDSDEHNDWRVEFELDVAKSREQGRPVLKLITVGPVA
jgi:superfamily II RNA helicase